MHRAFLILAAALGLAVGNAAGQPYRIVARTVAGYSSGGPFTLVGSFGQPTPSVLQGGRYVLADASFGAAVAIQQQGAPLLSIEALGSTVALSWPAESVGYQLESSATLKPTEPWLPVDAEVLIVSNRFVAIVPLTSGYRFYRLKGP